MASYEELSDDAKQRIADAGGYQWIKKRHRPVESQPDDAESFCGGFYDSQIQKPVSRKDGC